MIPRRFRRNLVRKRAVILLMTLWMVVVLALLASSLAFQMQIEMRLTSAHRDHFIAEQIARRAVSRAVVDLRNDILLDGMVESYADIQNRFDALGDVWFGGVEPREIETPGAGGEALGTSWILVVDEESKLVLNSYMEGSREAIKYLLMALDEREDDAEDIANCIWDWMDPDSIPVDPDYDNEEEFFEKMSERFRRERRTGRRPRDEEPEKIRPRNARFESVEELLEIPGVTPELFYGYDPEEVREPRFFPLLAYRDRRGERPGLRDLFTVRTFKTNLNTANYYTLTALGAAATGDLSSGRAVADAIISHRQGRSAEDIDNNHAFRQMQEAPAVSGMDMEIFEGMQHAANLTLQSDYFTIYARAEVGREGPSIRTSASDDRAREALPAAHIVADCQRRIIAYMGQASDDWEPPGFRDDRAAFDPLQRGELPRDAGSPNDEEGLATVWRVPVVYFKSWVSY